MKIVKKSSSQPSPVVIKPELNDCAGKTELACENDNEKDAEGKNWNNCSRWTWVWVQVVENCVRGGEFPTRLCQLEHSERVKGQSWQAGNSGWHNIQKLKFCTRKWDPASVKPWVLSNLWLDVIALPLASTKNQQAKELQQGGGGGLQRELHQPGRAARMVVGASAGEIE